MSCEFWMDGIRIPSLKLNQAEELLKKHDLDYVIELVETELRLTQGNMSYSTASDITDNLFPDLAELLNNTPEDGQLIDTECDDEHTTYFIYKGKVEEIPGTLVTITPEISIAVGETDIADIRVKALGLPGGKAAIVEYNVK